MMRPRVGRVVRIGWLCGSKLSLGRVVGTAGARVEYKSESGRRRRSALSSALPSREGAARASLLPLTRNPVSHNGVTNAPSDTDPAPAGVPGTHNGFFFDFPRRPNSQGMLDQAGQRRSPGSQDIRAG
jgi:hypothetical protein